MPSCKTYPVPAPPSHPALAAEIVRLREVNKELLAVALRTAAAHDEGTPLGAIARAAIAKAEAGG